MSWWRERGGGARCTNVEGVQCASAPSSSGAPPLRRLREKTGQQQGSAGPQGSDGCRSRAKGQGPSEVRRHGLPAGHGDAGTRHRTGHRTGIGCAVQLPPPPGRVARCALRRLQGRPAGAYSRSLDSVRLAALRFMRFVPPPTHWLRPRRCSQLLCALVLSFTATACPLLHGAFFLRTFASSRPTVLHSF